MKIFGRGQIKQIDAYTIQHEPVKSIDLMERAAGKLFSWISQHYGKVQHFLVFTGPGNNGGDGLALARMLASSGYSVEVYHANFTSKTSDDWNINHAKLKEMPDVSFTPVDSVRQMPAISYNDIIVDAIFGSGLTRPADGLTAEIIKAINDSGAEVVSIDIPSGLFCEDNSGNNYDSVIRAKFTLSFQFPKLAFMFPDTYRYTGEWKIMDIGLHPSAIANTQTQYYFISRSDILPLLKHRNRFDHKGVFGHGLMVAGSKGKMGAAILSSAAALRTGLGLLTCHIPECGYDIMQFSLPEAMVMTDASDEIITDVGILDKYQAVGAGPGLGTGDKTRAALKKLLSDCTAPMVLDADALNMISQEKEMIDLIPEGTVITPHPKEFERLAGESANGYQRLQKQILFSKEHRCIVVLKGAYTSVSLPDGRVFFNSTGNPGMATAGSGDVLTGMILSLLSQGYHPHEAAVTAVYLHGLAGDIASEENSRESVIASDIINCIGKAFKKIRTSDY